MKPTFRRVGFIADSFLPRLNSWQEGWRHPRVLWHGWRVSGSVATMRFRWIAEAIKQESCGLSYEWYRPWRRYAAVVFLKSMSQECHDLAVRLQKQSVCTIFDANVDYYTPASGRFYYEGMAPTPFQRKQAIAMTQICNAVIADSSHIAQQCQSWNSDVTWIPDNVNLYQVPPYQKWHSGSAPIPLIWSGEAVKLLDLLAIKNVLIKYSKYIQLILVTNARDAMRRWFDGLQDEFLSMLECVPHQFVSFRSIPELMKQYTSGGVVISPRFLDNSYNLGHTEWKITLGMACGRLAICSPVPSYVDVFKRSNGQGIRVCNTNAEWEEAFDGLLSGAISSEEEQAARDVVEKYYSTPVVASQHAALLTRLLARTA